MRKPSDLRRRDYLARAMRGGYPEAVRRESERRRERFFADYASDMIVRDVQQVAQIDRTAAVRRLLSLLAARTCGLVNMSRLGSAIGVTAADASAGRLIENLVFGELARQLTWTDFSARLYHYRDRDRYEVDAVLEDNAGEIVGVEVKAAETVKREDFRGLRLLRRRLGDRLRAGFVLYCGDESLSFGDGMVALPISALWTTAAAP